MSCHRYCHSVSHKISKLRDSPPVRQQLGSYKTKACSPRESFPARKNSHGRTGNRTRDLMISSQRPWPLDHEAGQSRKVIPGMLNTLFLGMIDTNNIREISADEKIRWFQFLLMFFLSHTTPWFTISHDFNACTRYITFSYTGRRLYCRQNHTYLKFPCILSTLLCS